MLTQNDMPDLELETCVRDQVGALKLEKQTTAHVAVEYPIDFAFVGAAGTMGRWGLR